MGIYVYTCIHMYTLRIHIHIYVYIYACVSYIYIHIYIYMGTRVYPPAVRAISLYIVRFEIRCHALRNIEAVSKQVE